MAVDADLAARPARAGAPIACVRRRGRRRFLLAVALVWVVAILLVAGVVHLASILLMPRLAARDAYSRLTAFAPPTGFAIVPGPRPGATVTPFADPATILAVCRFDLGAGPLRVRGAADEDNLMTLGFYARPGVVFHTIGERAALRGRLDVLLGTAAQIEAIEAADAEGAAPLDVRLTAPAATGFVLARAMPASPWAAEGLRKRLAALECAPGK